MSRSGNVTLKALGLFAIIGLLLVSGSSPALADAPEGSANEAGVVSGASFWFFKPEVIVANTEEEPVPVQNVDKLERMPFHYGDSIYLPDGTRSAGTIGLNIPPGKRLVIEFVTANYIADSDDNQLPIVSIQTYMPSFSPFSDYAKFNIPLTIQGSADDMVKYTGALTTRIYCEYHDSSDDINITALREGSLIGSAVFEVSLSGYAVDIAP
jgi:hypothetical protein